MSRRGEDLIAAINAGAADPVRSLGALIGQLSAEVEQSGSALREAIERNAGTSVTALAAAGDRLRNELSQVLDRLGQASVALDRVVGGAGEKLEIIQGDLGQKIDEMQRALGAMAAQVTELDRLSSTTQSESGVLIERMANIHGRCSPRSRAIWRPSSRRSTWRCSAAKRACRSCSPTSTPRARNSTRWRDLSPLRSRRVSPGPGARPGDQRRADVDDQGHRRDGRQPIRDDSRNAARNEKGPRRRCNRPTSRPMRSCPRS